jgi:hypothetical protein
MLLLGLAQLVPEASALPASCPPSKVKPGRAIYITSNEQRNSVIALPIGSNGLLSEGTTFSTGGTGSSIVTMSGNKVVPAAADVLSSQSALTVAGNVCIHA